MSEKGIGNKFLIDSDFDQTEYSSAVAIAPERPNSPELRLWVAVLGQMIEDATLPLARASSWPAAAKANAAHARAQVFARFGTTAEDFNMVCDLAGYDPSFIRKCVGAAIEREVQVTRESFIKINFEPPVPLDEELPD